MNTVQHKTKTISRHELRMHGPITARDLHDFVHQVDAIFEQVTGRKVEYDNDYCVTGDEDGLWVVFETKGKASS